MLLRRLRRTGCRDETRWRKFFVQYATIKSWFWTSKVLHFGVETTNHVESEHLVLKLWLSTCYGQIVEIKTSLEISKLKEKYGSKSNPILKNISNNISYFTLKKIWLESTRDS
ncbi:hypothetical protein M9H77_08801 [Catharanthus roseus]|uniref:Uncharacterized protein n=1 Tax=Catharanthus roseus TaxID=4058 RepID=A0ACC0BYU7_CATRO|nr:hypothetical protein M9H77_08801 [Catharanthus roseus]